MFNLLVVEDDVLLSDMIKKLLSQNNYEVVSAYSGTEALLIIEKKHFDLILLDLMLPGLPGETVLGEIRKKADTPVIGISAKTDIDSRINLIKNGADDYLVKPFDNAELIVSIEAVLRSYQKSKMCYTVLRFKDLTLNTDTLEVKIKDVPISLTKYEYLILQLLMSAPHKVFTKNNIFESVWNEEFLGDDNAINVQNSNLSKKFIKANTQGQYIQTVWGLGFKMQE